VNCLVAGGAGGLSACIIKNVIDMDYLKKEKIGGTKFQTKGRYDYSTQYANPYRRYDLFTIGRGLIAGSVMVSAPGIHYKLWIALILGAVGGVVQVGLTKALNKAKEDDPLQVF
jgi:hypothetical protein